ncbi:MAG: hypothetical protein ACYCPP_09650 [Nitrososphaerales archaeon]
MRIGSDLKLKEVEEVSVLEAMHTIIYGSNSGLERQDFPQVDMIIALDILSALTRFGMMTSKQLGNRLNCRPNRDTLRKYLKILVELGLISVDSTSYRGIAKARKSFQATEKGKEFVTSAGKVLGK